MVTIILTLMILCNFVLGLSTPILIIPVLAIFLFGGAGVIGLISYYIERKKIRPKTSSNFLKILFINYIVLLAIYSIYMISWGGIMECNVITSFSYAKIASLTFRKNLPSPFTPGRSCVK